MREADEKDEDASFPEEWEDELKKSERDKYFDFYDDIKTSIKEDW